MVSKRLLLLAAAAVAASGCSDAIAPDRPATRPTAPGHPPRFRASGTRAGDIPGAYIVVLRDDIADARGAAARLAGEHGAVVTRTYETAVRGFSARAADVDAAALSADADVQFVEPDQVVTVAATESPSPWGLDRIDQRALPLSNTFTYPVTGAGVNVYILDSGIRTTHREFGGRASGAFTAINDGNGTNDCEGHGTHVAGTVGGATYGVAKGVRLFAVRVTDCNRQGTTSGIIAGVDWVTANHVKPAVANMSLATPASAALDQAVQNSIAAGVVYAIAAANDTADACLKSPARVPEALTVAASSSTDARASFSNFGTCVDLFAPGVNVQSATIKSDTATSLGNGTSMASPHVAGVAALYLELHPTATPTEVTNAILSNATPGVITNPGAGTPNRLLYSGFITTGTPPADQPPVARYTVTCSALKCTFDGRTSTDDNGIVQRRWELGDGTVFTNNNATGTYTYKVAGTYTTKLTVTDAAGQSNTMTQTITVGSAPPPPPPPPPTDQPPVASYTVTCDAARRCVFNSSASTDDHGIVQHRWEFGNGVVFTNNTVTGTYTYPASGTYTSRLTVTDTVGQTSTATVQVTLP